MPTKTWFHCLVAIGVLLLSSVGCGRGDPTAKPVKGQQLKADELAKARREYESELRGTPLEIKPAVPSIFIKAWGVKETATDALARIGAGAVPSLIEALSDPNPEVREQAALALARMGPEAKPAVDALIKALDDRETEVRKSAARALGQIGPDAQAAVPALLKILHEADTGAG